MLKSSLKSPSGLFNDDNNFSLHKIYIKLPAMKTLQNCSQLMQLTQNGDKKAYQDLLEICQHVLHHFYNNRVHNKTDKDDIIQEVLLAIHHAKHTYHSKNPFSAWFFSIARHKLYDYYSYQKKYKKNNDTDINNIIDHTNYLSNKEDWEILYLAIDQLKPIQQQVIKLKKFHDFSIKEIARKINKSEAATKVTLHRSYHSLKKIMLKLTLIAIIINLFYLKIINIHLR